jgi:hypothetical protein
MMKPFRLPSFAVALLGVPVLACSSSVGGEGSSDAGGKEGIEASSPSRDAGPVHEGVGTSGRDASADASDGAVPSIVMPHISNAAPAFSSSSAGYQSVASAANDDNPLTAWSPSSLPAWIAYDVSGAPLAERQKNLVVWNALHAGSYLNSSPPTGADMPTDYTIEVNSALGGTAAPPTNGWVSVASVSNNLLNTVESPVSLGGANWVRMTTTAGTDGSSLAIDLDVYSAPHGATDCWLFMGDSITYITMPYAWNDVPKLVNAIKPDRWPAVINGAIGGTNTVTAAAVIDDTMQGYPGLYVALPYGTNDNVSEGAKFEMETLVQHVFAAGKIPVVPHMPWSDIALIQTNGPIINKAIDALYEKYPKILKGPDLWAAFLNRTDLIPSGDVHPNSMGQEVLRQQWANVMAAVP